MTASRQRILLRHATSPVASVGVLLASVGRRRHLFHCVAPMALTTVAFAFLYWDVFRTLVQQWSTIDANSHGFLIPLVSAYLVWTRRDRLAHASWRPAPVAGLGALCCGMAALALGRLSEIATIAELSMLPTLVGLVLALFGWSVLRHVYLAILYLVFMMPLLDPFMGLHPPLQAFAATTGSRILSLAGVPVFRTESLIYLPNAAIEVAKACSGVNNLVAMLAIGVVIAELTLERRHFRVMFMAFAVLVALFANPVRVALIGALLNSGYDRYLPGDGHQAQGLAVSVGAFMLLIGVANLLRPFAARPIAAGKRSPESARAGAAAPRLWLPALACVLLLTVGAAHTALLFGLGAGPDRDGPAAPPPAVGDWRAANVIPKLSSSNLAAVLTVFRARIYGRGIGELVAVATDSLFLAGEQSATLASVLAVEDKILVTNSSGHGFQVNRAVLRQSGATFQILYWYQVNGLIVDNKIEARLRGAVGRLVRRPESAVVVAVMAPMAPGEPLPDYLLEFTRELLRVSSGATLGST